MKRVDFRLFPVCGRQFDSALDRLHQHRQFAGIHAAEQRGVFKRHVRVECVCRDRQQNAGSVFQRLIRVQRCRRDRGGNRDIPHGEGGQNGALPAFEERSFQSRRDHVHGEPVRVQRQLSGFALINAFVPVGFIGGGENPALSQLGKQFRKVCAVGIVRADVPAGDPERRE